MIFTDIGFHLKSRFKKILLSQKIVVTSNLDSRKNCPGQRLLSRTILKELVLCIALATGAIFSITAQYIIANNGILKLNSSVLPSSEGYISQYTP